MVHRRALTLSAISPLPVSRIDFRTRQCLLSPVPVPCRQPPGVPCPGSYRQREGSIRVPSQCHKSRRRLRFSLCTELAASRFPSQTRGVIPRTSPQLSLPNLPIPTPYYCIPARLPPRCCRGGARTSAHVVMWWSVFSSLSTLYQTLPHVWVDHSCRPCSSGQIWRDENLAGPLPSPPPADLPSSSPDDPSP